MLSRSYYLGNNSMFDLSKVNILTKETSEGSQLATSIIKIFATIVYGWTLLTSIITKSSIVDLAGYPRYTSLLVTRKR